MTKVSVGNGLTVKGRRPSSIRVSEDGAFKGSQPEINFTGDVSVTNDPANSKVTVNVTGGSVTLSSLGTTLQTAANDTPLDADTFNFYDAVDSILKKVSWANIKATLKTYFDTIYDAIGAASAALTSANSYTDTGLSGKQATLVSGTNIKTINSSSILGSGDLTISGGGFESAADNYYVNASTGSDSNDGLTSGTPFLTIQKAFNVLQTKVIASNVSVNVAAGSYSEKVTVASVIYVGNYRVSVLGASTVDDTGTSESGVSYSYSGGVVTAKLTDTNKSWTVNQHQKKILKIISGAAFNTTPELNYYVIRANTATSLEIVGDWNQNSPSTNTVYEILTLTTIISGATNANLELFADRISFQNFKFDNATGFSVYAYKGQLNMLVGCHIVGDGYSNVASLNGGLRMIGCYSDGTGLSNSNIGFYESFSLGDYAENFITSDSFTNSKTGIKGCWIDKGDLLLAGSHSRITGCYFTAPATYAIQVIRKSSTSLYGNDGTGLNINLLDSSFMKIHSGNIFNVVAGDQSSIDKKNEGGWFTSKITELSITKSGSMYGTGFTATTEKNLSLSHKARIYKSANQSIANASVVVQVTFDSTRFDPQTMKSGNTLVAPVDGIYMIGFNGTFAADATGTRRISRIRLNGATDIAIQVVAATANQAPVNIVTTYFLSAGNTIDVTVSHDATGAINLQALGNWSAELWMLRVD